MALKNAAIAKHSDFIALLAGGRKGLHSLPIENLHKTEVLLFKLFEEELNSKSPVLLKYSPSAVHKAAKFITGTLDRTASIGIAGETASGKSTAACDIIDTLNEFAQKRGINNFVTRVNTDDYYYDRSEEVKKAGGMAKFAKTYDFDTPEALELSLMKKHIQELTAGRSVKLPKYDMSGTAVRKDEAYTAYPSRIIISEGLFTLTEKIREAFDFKIYVEIDEQLQKERFFRRAGERGLGSAAHSMYKNASEKAEIYIRKYRDTADIVLSGQAERKNYKLFVNKILFTVTNKMQSAFLKKYF